MNSLIPFSLCLLFLTGCLNAEYQLTTNPAIHPAESISSISIAGTGDLRPGFLKEFAPYFSKAFAKNHYRANWYYRDSLSFITPELFNRSIDSLAPDVIVELHATGNIFSSDKHGRYIIGHNYFVTLKLRQNSEYVVYLKGNIAIRNESSDSDKQMDKLAESLCRVILGKLHEQQAVAG